MVLSMIHLMYFSLKMSSPVFDVELEIAEKRDVKHLKLSCKSSLFCLWNIFLSLLGVNLSPKLVT